MNKCYVVAALLLFVTYSFGQDLAVVTSTYKIKIKEPPVTEAKPIPLSEVNKNIGNNVVVCGKVYNVKLLKNIKGQPTLLNLGGDLPNERVELRIRFDDLPKFDYNPEKIFLHKQVCITGIITNEHGFAEIIVDTNSTRQLLNNSLISKEDVSEKLSGKIKLLSNAYLFAGPSINEAIISHIKEGSLVFVEYSEKGYSYVRVIEKAITSERPAWMCGFVRNQALGLSKSGRLPGQKKQNNFSSKIKY